MQEGSERVSHRPQGSEWVRTAAINGIDAVDAKLIPVHVDRLDDGVSCTDEVGCDIPAPCNAQDAAHRLDVGADATRTATELRPRLVLKYLAGVHGSCGQACQHITSFARPRFCSKCRI